MIPRLPFWWFLLIGAIEEGDDLAARAGRIRAERRGRGAVGHAVFDCPQNSIIVVAAGGNIGEGGRGGLGSGAALGTPQEGHSLRAVAVGVGGEGGGGGAGGCVRRR